MLPTSGNRRLGWTMSVRDLTHCRRVSNGLLMLEAGRLNQWSANTREVMRVARADRRSFRGAGLLTRSPVPVGVNLWLERLLAFSSRSVTPSDDPVHSSATNPTTHRGRRCSP